MPWSRSPSPLPGGGEWSSPGLTPGSGSTTPHSFTSQTSPGPAVSNDISWATAKAKSDQVRGYPSFATENSGFFSRHKRKISGSLPRFALGSPRTNGYIDKDKLGRDPRRHGARFGPVRRRPLSFLRSILRRRRFGLLGMLVLAFIGYLMFWTSLVESYRKSSFGGGRKFVVILASNVEGGVMEWKGAREWAIERNSIWNKKKYTKRWGYELEVVNMLAKKRYSHEWRESWEKVDVIREVMRKHPEAEWFWWLDLNTWIMEYSYSLQHHLFDRLEHIVYRDIRRYNPLNITHPLDDFYLDEISRSPAGDGDVSSIQLVLSQDCDGFNLGSFFIRRSIWSDRLMDAWWDPVMYEQKHMEWEHKEQDALEYLYSSQPWIRSGVAFLPQRAINSFPEGACADIAPDPGIHYEQSGRDFVVNMAGCQFGRDCWGEVYRYRELSNWLNRTRWERFKDGLSAMWKKVTGTADDGEKGQQQQQQQ